MSINLSYLILFGHKVNVSAWLTVSGGYYFTQNRKAKTSREEGWQSQKLERDTLCHPVGLRKTTPDHEQVAGRRQVLHVDSLSLHL